MWSEESANIVKKNFITVAVSGHVTMSRKDADGEFIRDTCGIKLAGAGGNIEMLTAGGRRLGNIRAGGEIAQTIKGLKNALAAFDRLPANERQPGAVNIGERGAVDADVLALAPPKGGLILKLHYRTLSREKDGSLRHAVARDFSNQRLQIPYVTHFGETFEAQPDHMWLTEAESKSLIPAKLEKGDLFNVPAAIQDRLVRFHLVPHMAFGEAAAGWDPKKIRAREMTLFVQEANAENIRMRLDGQALLGADFAAYEGEPLAQGYEPRMLGFLTYDVPKKAFTRFDLVALGDAYGKQGGSNHIFYRPGRNPLGVAFELVSGNSPVDRIPPRAAVKYHTPSPRYLGNGN